MTGGCHICWSQAMTAPIMLSCGHLYCWPCIKDLLATPAEAGRLCPTCRQRYQDMRPAFNIPGSVDMTEEDLAEYGVRPSGVFMPEPEVHVTPPPSPIPLRRSERSRTRPANQRRFFNFITDDRSSSRSRSRSRSPLSNNSGDIELPSPTRQRLETPHSPSNMSQEFEAVIDHPVDGAEELIEDTEDLDDIQWSQDMGSEAGPSNQLQAPQRFLRTSLVPDTEITHIELTLSCILNEMTSRQVKVKNISHRNIARKMKRKFRSSFGRKDPKQISKISGNIVEKAITAFESGRNILPDCTGSTEAKQDQMKHIIQEILRLDEIAPETPRSYARRNPPVQRSSTGRPVLPEPLVGVIAPDHDNRVSVEEDQQQDEANLTQDDDGSQRGGFNQQIMTRTERQEANSLLRLNQPFAQARRRNAAVGEGAREQSLEEVAEPRPRTGSAQELRSFISQNVIQNITRPRESVMADLQERMEVRREERLARELEERVARRREEEERRREEKEDKEERRRIEREDKEERRMKELSEKFEREERLRIEKDEREERRRVDREEREDRQRRDCISMAMLSKSITSSETPEIIKEIKVNKDVEDDADSPEFPLLVGISTMESFVSDLKLYLDSSESIDGVVKENKDSSKEIITQTKQLPKEATASVVKKKGKAYIKLTIV